ncbi:MAG: aminoglycoside phosphotransferase family protein [Alphaproteobacteria bacterium]|nr:aminoglycoside phosphotransferase family protein [Alphaproteobacteria bacterium]
MAAWPALAGQPVRPLAGGLINASWVVGDPPVAALQRLHPVFGPTVHLDIEAVTAHVAARGMRTPRLLRTAEDGLWHVDDEGACWRALSWVPGVTWHKLRTPAQAAAAGALVARWHQATDDLAHDFVHRRPLAHDTDHHMGVLREALAAHRDHRLYDRVAPVADAILSGWDRWDGRTDHPPRVAHGDLKISNLRFSEAGEGLCLLDLDTMGPLSLDVELGDAWRSWCNPAAEDSSETRFDLDLFEASAKAYLTVRPLDAAVRATLPAGVERICLELSARFCADALRESYFGWSPAVAPTRGEHNLLRAEGQLALARSAASARPSMARILTV